MHTHASCMRVQVKVHACIQLAHARKPLHARAYHCPKTLIQVSTLFSLLISLVFNSSFICISPCSMFIVCLPFTCLN